MRELIEYSVVRAGREGVVVSAELQYAGQLFRAEMVLWIDGGVDLLIYTSHCLERMLLTGVQGWLQCEKLTAKCTKKTTFQKATRATKINRLHSASRSKAID